MGVRGLTSYIAKNADRYLEPFELHDCNLVIDGDSLSSNLYRWNSQCNSAFGGDYDQYYRTVVQFVQCLRQCNVTPYVLLDGGYPRKKLATVRSRLRSKIGAVKHINPFACLSLFPLMMREVFVDAIKDCGVPYMRCIFEADDEVAILARTLNCPVLSYDSDFYIHNVQYIPSVTLTAKVKRKKLSQKMQKKLNKDNNFVNSNESSISSTDAKYNFLDCCLYKIENLVKGQLTDDMLPLFAALLGNDYVNRKLFKKFFNQISLKRCGGKRDTKQQRQIIALLKWLQHETYESALKKVLGRLPQDERMFVLRQIKSAMSGYNAEESRSFSYFNINADIHDEQRLPIVEKMIDYDDISSSECESDEENEDESGTDSDDAISEETDNDGDKEKKEDEEFAETFKEDSSFKHYTPPEWILSKFLKADVPRYVIDLRYLKLYVNAPQIENFLLSDCNEIAVPILQFIFALLHYPNNGQTFQYLTRVKRISNVHYKTITGSNLMDSIINYDRCDDELNAKLFKCIFETIPNHLDIFQQIELLPSHLKLFILAIVYWANTSSIIEIPYIHAAVICYCVLGEADQRYSPISRDYRVFQKRYGNVLKQFESRQQHNELTSPKSIAEICSNLSKDESIALVNQLLSHFYINDKIRERHTNYSSTVIHTYAELQSVIFHLNSLNALLNKPYESIHVAKCINGTFLYNMYVTLKDRPNIQHYVKHHIFRNCTEYYQLYEKIIDTLALIVKCLMIDQSKMKRTRLQNRRRNKQQQRQRQKQSNADDVQTKEVDDGSEKNVKVDGSSDSEFEDANNMFSKLLLKN